MDRKVESLRSQIAIRCAKAMVLLSSLPNRHSKATLNDEDVVKELMMREIRDLKVELAKERIKRKKIEVCSFVEVVLQVLMVLFVSSFFLMLAFKPN